MPDYSKNKVLALYKYLAENTDENHSVTMQEIIEHMRNQGYAYSRDTAKRNVKQLREELGIDVISSKGKYARYYVGARLLEMEELKLIVDSVNASNFIEKEIAKKMTSKLKSIVSKYEAEELQRNFDRFFSLARQYTHIETLDRDTLITFIERIEVGPKELPPNFQATPRKQPYRQKIRIFYKFIGELDKEATRELSQAVSL